MLVPATQRKPRAEKVCEVAHGHRQNGRHVVPSRSMRFARGGLLAIAVAWLVACDSLFGIEEGQPVSVDGGVDSSVEAGADSGSEAATEASAADTASDAPLCAGPTIYVSATTGSDSNAGCSSSAPKKTIGAAIAGVAAVATVTGIEVCKGTYNENPLVLTAPASLRGSYSCSTWTRTATYGYPTFDAVNATVIQNAAVSAESATLNVSGAAVTAAVVVDGLTILGATSGTTSGTVMALITTSNAAPTLSNNELTGGSLTAPSGNASVGVGVFTGSTPTITNNKINGGSGVVPPTSTENGHASVGILADGTSSGVQIVSNVVDGGSGTASNSSAGGSIALELLGTASPGPSYTVRGNTLVGGTGTSVGSSAAAGLYLGGTASLTLDSNGIDGGGGATGANCGTGVYANATGTITITGNRIYGGNCGVTASTSSPYGVLLEGPVGPTIVYNNMIHAGTTTNAASLNSSAILLNGVVGVDVRHNTLVAGTHGAALWPNTATTGTKIANNILAGSGADTGLVVTCGTDAGAPALASLENNVVFGTTMGLFRWNGCFADAAYGTIDATTAQLLATETGATVQGNVTLASTCTTDAGTDSGCIVSAGCTTPQTCLTTFFGGWDVASFGYKNLFPAAPFVGACPTAMAPPEGNGWTIALTPTPPCKVTRSSLDDHGLTGLGVDLYGNCRTSTPSMGAEEDSAAACQ
jgi:hypothetical protein